MNVDAGAEVRLEGLTKVFGSVVAVRDVSLTIGAGSFFTLLGPSGSGKTTTLMMIAGFVHPTRGVIAIDGVDVAARPPQKRDLGMVFQSYAVFPHLTVFENVAFPLRVRKIAGPEIREFLPPRGRARVLPFADGGRIRWRCGVPARGALRACIASRRVGAGGEGVGDVFDVD